MLGKYVIYAFLCLCVFSRSYGVDLELTQGQNKALPISLVNFLGDDNTFISNIIKKDLTNSAEFKFVQFDAAHAPHNSLETQYTYWKSIGVNNLIVGDIKKQGTDLSLQFQLLDPISKSHIMLNREYKIPNDQKRALAHHISDLIYQQLTGHKGIFSTRLAYVQVIRSEGKKPSYELNVSDYDGENKQILLTSAEPIMSPSWSPDSKKIAYVSFENKKSEIYSVNTENGHRKLISSFPGINGAPTWSPDSKHLAMVLSKTGSPKIYLYTLADSSFKQLTKGSSIDTEPSFSTNGKHLIFTSNRGGSPQIYQLNLTNQTIKRLTYVGNYNASASYTPLEKELILLHRDNRSFSISVQNIKSGLVTPLTFSKFDESPSLSPNGEMIVYASKYANKGILKISSINGKVNFKLPKGKGDLQEPSWSFYLK